MTVNLYRGKTGGFPRGVIANRFLKEPRHPKDTYSRTHEIADNWFFSQFGIRARSQTLMCTTNIKQAYGYGPFVGIIEPVGSHKLIASEEVDDFIEIYRQVSREANEAAVENWLSQMNYVCLDHLSLLSDDFRGEVMLFCQNYEAKAVPGYTTYERG